jgi:two-component system phosphate regulon sensor histidine kinase PhoR
MPRRRLLWKVLPGYVLLVAVCIFGVLGYAFRSVREFYHSHVGRDLEARARLVRRQVGGQIAAGQGEELRRVTRELGRLSGARVTLIDRGGEVLGDSERDPTRMENHANRPEVKQALAGELGRSTRYSSTIRADMMYVAVGVRDGGPVQGVVRTSTPLTEVEGALAAIWRGVWLGGLGLTFLAAVVSALLVRRVSGPLRAIAGGAERFADGDLKHKVAVPDTEEMAELADSLNRMAAQLDERLRAVTLERNEREAILASMVEGVVAVDREERVISLNQAARDMLGAGEGAVEGRALQEAARNVLLERFVRHVLDEDEPVEGEIVLHNGKERYVLARGASLRDEGGRRIGAVIVLHDVTQMRRLEDVRRDFVANVSHELRTPVTAIQGFVETLRERAAGDPQKTERFLDIISRQAGRLNQIIEDLLALSRIEREAGLGPPELVLTHLEDLLSAAIADCQVTAREHDVTVELECSEDLTVEVSPQLLEQAVANLLDNAIKYSEPGGRVRVSADRAEEEAVVRVADTGCGIPAEHLPRIFERFYRVDKGRSRKLGGTGLGLAIVKHIAQAHGGRASVESTVGEGSVFSIHLPVRHA